MSWEDRARPEALEQDEMEDSAGLRDQGELQEWEQIHHARAKRQPWFGGALLLMMLLPWASTQETLRFWWDLSVAVPSTGVMGSTSLTFGGLGLGLVVVGALRGVVGWRNALYCGAGLGIGGIVTLWWGGYEMKWGQASMMSLMGWDGLVMVAVLTCLAVGCDLRARVNRTQLGAWSLGVGVVGVLVWMGLVPMVSLAGESVTIAEAGWHVLGKPLIDMPAKVSALALLSMMPLSAAALVGLGPHASSRLGHRRGLLRGVGAWALLYMPTLYALLTLGLMLRSASIVLFGLAYIGCLFGVLLLTLRDGLSLWIEGWERRHRSFSDEEEDDAGTEGEELMPAE